MAASENSLAVSSPANPVADAARPNAQRRRRFTVFGTGFGLVVNGTDLDAVIVRSRPSSSSLVASVTIRDFGSRPAAEWGAELSRFLANAGEPRLAATLILPRTDVIVRTVRLSGVNAKDTKSAIELQLDTLHPWAEEDVLWTWWRVSLEEVAVGLVRSAVISRFETLFSEAAISLAAITFSSAAIHSALRLRDAAQAPIFCSIGQANGLEIYGESASRPCYSAGFQIARERALSVARSELRLAPDAAPMPLGSLLEAPVGVPDLAWAAAIASSAPFAVRFANLLPPERRATHSRTRYLIPAVLGLLLVIGAIFIFVVFPLMNERRYASELTAEMKRLQPVALKIQSLDRNAAAGRSRTASLDDFRGRPQADLDLLAELVRVMPAQAWTNSIEIFPDSVVLAGEIDHAAPLLKLLDASPLFQNSEFVMSVTHNGNADQFRIRTMRRGRVGRTTP